MRTTFSLRLVFFSTSSLRQKLEDEIDSGPNIFFQIENTTVSDDDVYACQISEADGESSIISAPARLTVLGEKLCRPYTKKHELASNEGHTLLLKCIPVF